MPIRPRVLEQGLWGPTIPARDAPKGIPLSDHSVVTPLRHSQFESELRNHDRGWVSWLLKGITDGVPLGYTGLRQPSRSRNLQSALSHPEVIEAELLKELRAGRIAGPFATTPLANLRCSGIGAIPKKNGKWRMIVHLSAPRGSSVNDGIDKEQYSLHYSSVDEAVALLQQAGWGASMAKVDLKAAFQMIPVGREDWELLGMVWRDAIYVDKCLPFGLRSAPYLFNQYARALSWILKTNYSIKRHIHYLDDYLMVGEAGSNQCSTYLATMLKLCERLGVPVAAEKVEGPSTSIVFLGILLDSVTQELSLPAVKLQEFLSFIHDWCMRRKCTKRQLLSLVGKLLFAARVVPAGRFFLRRLVELSCTVHQLHHHIYLNEEARADIAWWRDFLPHWNGRAMFLDSNWSSSQSLDLFTDASGLHGYGAYFQGAWLRQSWLPHQALMDIQWKELYTIVVAAMAWGNWVAVRYGDTVQGMDKVASHRSSWAPYVTETPNYWMMAL